MNEEIWKPVSIEPFNKHYQVSSLGRVKSLERKYVIKDTILKLHKDDDGYLHCGFNLRGLKKTLQVHRLVGLSFIPNPLNNPLINHKDGNRENNVIDNLEWVTPSENMIHSFRVLKRVHPLLGRTKGRCPVAKKVAKLAIDDGSVIKIYDSLVDANDELGTSSGSIVAVCKGKRKTAFGFKWRYVDKKNNNGVRTSSVYANPVLQSDKSGVVIAIWKNAVEAANSINGCADYITDVCRGRRELAYKCKWCYATSAEIESLNQKSEP